MRLNKKTIFLFLFLIEVYSILPNKKPFVKNPQILRGIIHVHSIFSDGGGTPDEIMRAANDSHTDFLILTDHNNTESRKEYEKRYQNSDLFVEMEASTHGGHLLAFSSLSDAKNFSDSDIRNLSFAHFVGEKTYPGFFAAIAHPSNIKNSWTRLDKFTEGFEVTNFDSVWQRNLSDSVLGFLSTLIVYPFNQYLGALKFFTVYEKDLAAWDNQSRLSGEHFGILAHDTHAKLKLNDEWFWKWPDYPSTFKLAANYLFLKTPPSEDFQERKKQIYESIKKGRLALVYDSINPFNGNEWKVTCGNLEAQSGETISFHDNCQTKVKIPELPYPYEIKWVRNGEVIETREGNHPEENWDLKLPGVYRVEIWLSAHSLFRVLLNKKIPYILYNPIKVI